MTGPEILYQAETEILEEIARLLRGGKIESAEWKIDRLRKLGALNEKAAQVLARYRDAVRAGVIDDVENAALSALTKSEGLFNRARLAGADLRDVLPIDADPALRATITAWQSSARTQMDLAMATMLENSGQVYVDTINKAALRVLVGEQSMREALVSAVHEWADVGIPSIVDRAGRQWSTEAYANMVLRTNTRRVTTEVQMERAKEYGADLIEVSAHAGARPGCEPYQGRIFSLSGEHETYPPFSETSYGDPGGLFGINCGHMQYPFFEGISRQTYAPTEDEAENARQYEESQTQRRYEREIRAAKRELAVFESLGDADAVAKAKALVRDRQAAMREFIADTGRTRRNAREQIYD